jgi:hypothetical protein
MIEVELSIVYREFVVDLTYEQSSRPSSSPSPFLADVVDSSSPDFVIDATSPHFVGEAPPPDLEADCFPESTPPPKKMPQETTAGARLSIKDAEPEPGFGWPEPAEAEEQRDPERRVRAAVDKTTFYGESEDFKVLFTPIITFICIVVFLCAPRARPQLSGARARLTPPPPPGWPRAQTSSTTTIGTSRRSRTTRFWVRGRRR